MSTKKFSEGLYPWVPVDGQASAPATPATDTFRLYVTDTGDLALVDDAGTVVTFLTEAPAADNPTTVEINTETASYTLVADDAGKVVRMNAGSAVNLTVPAEASVDYDVGTVIEVRQVGAGTVTVVEDTGVTVNIESGLTLDLRGQYASVSLHKVGSDTWEAAGGFAEDES
jgi:hypothetical protein